MRTAARIISAVVILVALFILVGEPGPETTLKETIIAKAIGFALIFVGGMVFGRTLTDDEKNEEV